MELKDLKINEKLLNVLDIAELRPCQEKAVKKGLLDWKSLLICSPTASGKTLVAELACINSILEGKGKAVYIVPLKALANEKFKEFKEKYGNLINIGLKIGDIDKKERVDNFDLIFCTSEKLDSMLRHDSSFVKNVKVVVVDEIHLLNDPGRGPCLEILITMLKKMLSDVQLIGLSATIGNPEQLASWLEAELVVDNWRPVKLEKGIYLNGEVEFY